MYNRNQFLLDPTVIELRNLAFDDDYDQSSDRVELLVTASTFDGLPDNLLQTDNLMYSVTDTNRVTNPAFEQIRNLYGQIAATDRVEVLVWDDHHHLKHAIIDVPVSQYMRGYQRISKHQGTVGVMIEKLNTVATSLHVQPLRIDEVDKAEQVMDQHIVTSLKENSAF